MKYIKLLILFLIIFIMSCNKRQENKIDNLKEFGVILNLKNYDIKKTKINDSIIIIEGKNNTYNTSGKYNIFRKQKTGWWRFNKNEDKVLDIEYVSYDGNEMRNQVIFYKKGEIDTTSSKFYTLNVVRNMKGNLVFHSFNIYTPQIETKMTKTLFDYIYYRNNEVLKENAIENRMHEGNKYIYKINLDDIKSDKFFFEGIFSEITIDKQITEVGRNAIYIQDTLTLNQN